MRKDRIGKPAATPKMTYKRYMETTTMTSRQMDVEAATIRRLEHEAKMFACGAMKSLPSRVAPKPVKAKLAKSRRNVSTRAHHGQRR